MDHHCFAFPDPALTKHIVAGFAAVVGEGLHATQYDTLASLMPSLTPAQVRHIAKLARLNLDDAEVEKYAKELTNILGYIEMLQEVDTKGVEPTAQVTGRANVLRDDVIWETPIAEPDALLATSPLPIVEHQIQTPSAHG